MTVLKSLNNLDTKILETAYLNLIKVPVQMSHIFCTGSFFN